MSLEDKIEALTKAVEANTAALKAAGGSSGGAASSSSAGSTKAAASTTTQAAMQALLNKVKTEKDADTAKKIIKDAGGVTKMAEIPEDKYDAVAAACKKALEAAADDI